jgi:hypothetical protein
VLAGEGNNMQMKVQFPINKEKAIELLGKIPVADYTIAEGEAINNDPVIASLVRGTGVLLLEARMKGKSVSACLVSLTATSLQLGYLLALDRLEAEKFDKMFES